MKTILAVVLLVFAAAQPLHAKPAPKKSNHAMMRILKVAASPVTHPVRTVKQVFGSVLFAVETGIDGARLVLDTADKALEACCQTGYGRVAYPVYYVVDKATDIADKADTYIEGAEQSLFGHHN